MNFNDLGLEPNILKALEESGYTTPTPIQIAAIPEALKGRDVLGIAQTGTGKTASFTLPMIQRLARGRARARMPRTLVLCPTRELAAQVADNFEKYGKHYKLTMALLIGGVSFGDQDAKLTRGVDVLIATPGRLLDHFERGRLLLTGIEVMVVDEADRMLDMGFIPDIERIFKLTPMTRQTLFFSATMPPEIQRITNTFLTDPARIEVARPATTAELIDQRIIRVPSKDEAMKRMALRKLLEGEGVKNGIIFCNRKSTVDMVAKSLQRHGFNARPIHGDLAQSFRTETLDQFRDGVLQFLVASDVAARGLDIPAVSHVFNFDIPVHSDDYVHRIGRTGRAGRSGCAYTLMAPRDEEAYTAILKTIGKTEIQEVDLGDFFKEASDALALRGPSPANDRGRPAGGAKGSRSRRGGERAQIEDRRTRTARPEPAAVDAVVETTRPEPMAPAAAATPASRPAASHQPNRSGSAERAPAKDRRRPSPGPDKVAGFGDEVPSFMLR